MGEITERECSLKQTLKYMKNIYKASPVGLNSKRQCEGKNAQLLTHSSINIQIIFLRSGEGRA